MGRKREGGKEGEGIGGKESKQSEFQFLHWIYAYTADFDAVEWEAGLYWRSFERGVKDLKFGGSKT